MKLITTMITAAHTSRLFAMKYILIILMENNLHLYHMPSNMERNTV